MTIKLVFTASVLNAQNDSVENKWASLLETWGKALGGTPHLMSGRHGAQQLSEFFIAL